MNGSPVVGELLTNTLGGMNARIVSSDGPQNNLANSLLLAELQDQGLDISRNTPPGPTAAFNNGVCNIQPTAPTPDTPVMQPKPDVKLDSMVLGG